MSLNERSVRAFTLDYYRSLGARCFPADPEATAKVRWQVSFDGQSPKTLNFDPDAPDGIAPGSPAWREVVDACVQRPTISYRYVTSGVVDPRAIVARTPLGGYELGKIKMHQAKRHLAVATTYRVTYDAPAMPARREELCHHVFDPQGNPLDVLTESLYSLQTLPLDPPEGVDYDWEAIHRSALVRIDERSTVEGEAIEQGLSMSLEEAMERIDAYYGQQRQKAGTEEERETIERLREGAIAEEKARHEVTVSTELVALCAVYYDEIHYLVEIKHGNRQRWTEFFYLPVTDEIRLPPCPVCGESLSGEETVLNERGQLVCLSCTKQCSECGKLVPKNKFLDRCALCGELLCEDCAVRCSDCGRPLCQEHQYHCSDCGKPLCEGCMVLCHTCGKPVCQEHAVIVAEKAYCADHAGTCHGCGEVVTKGLVCEISGDLYCPLCLTTCVVCGRKISKEHAVPSPTGQGLICGEHLAECACCGETIFTETALECPHCGDTHCASDALVCPVCGQSGCARCVGEEGCPTCRDLRDVSPADERLNPVKEWFPKLKPIRWRLSDNGRDVLVEWTDRSGQWGVVAYGKEDHAFRYAYRYGPFSAFLQKMMGRRKRSA